jgi:hypothetical protein
MLRLVVIYARDLILDLRLVKPIMTVVRNIAEDAKFFCYYNGICPCCGMTLRANVLAVRGELFYQKKSYILPYIESVRNFWNTNK